MYDDRKTPYESVVSLGEAFAKYRKSLKISQQRLHEMTGISIFTISQFENGKGHGLSLSHFLLLMDAVRSSEISYILQMLLQARLLTHMEYLYHHTYY